MSVQQKTTDLPDGETPEQLFSFSLFKRATDNEPRLGRMTWAQLCEFLRKRSVRKHKDGALISGAAYKDGATRSNATATEISIAILDFDHDADLPEIEAHIEKLCVTRAVAAFVYSTFSHTPDTPKFRIVLPLSVPVAATEWPRVWQQLSLAFGEKCDAAAKDAARMHYLPSSSPEMAQFAVAFSIEGEPLDVQTLPELSSNFSRSGEVLPSGTQKTDAYAQKAFANEVARVCMAAHGKRNITLNNAAFALGKFVGAGRLTRAEAESALLNAATSIHLSEDEARKAIRSGLDKGELDPTTKGLHASANLENSTFFSSSFSEKIASEIPSPALRTDKGAPEYAPRQLVELLRPAWESSALDSQGAMSQRIAEELKDEICYVPALGWIFWNGKHWEIDDKAANATAARVLSLSKTVREEAAELYRYTGILAAAGRDGDAGAMGRAAGQHLRHARQMEQLKFIQGALGLVAGRTDLRAKVEQFDLKPFVRGFLNGVWDKGEWREHRRTDFLLNLCPVAYNANANPSEWWAVLERITGGDWAFAVTLQHLCGYILSGAPNLRLLPWFYGPGGTGKSTVAELLQTVLGELAAQIPGNVMDGREDSGRTGAKLWTKCLGVCSEVGNRTLDAELLKTFSGGDRLAVKLHYKENFTALPKHCLLMVANHTPRLNAYDPALKMRVKTLPFDHPLDEGGAIELTSSTCETGATLLDARQDPKSALVAGFLMWAVDGLAHVYKTQRISWAPIVEQATARFWLEVDTLTPFWSSLDDNFNERLKTGVTKEELRDTYERWCETEGAQPIQARNWKAGCLEHGLIEFKLYLGPGKQPHAWRLSAPRRISA